MLPSTAYPPPNLSASPTPPATRLTAPSRVTPPPCPCCRATAPRPLGLRSLTPAGPRCTPRRSPSRARSLCCWAGPSPFGSQWTSWMAHLVFRSAYSTHLILTFWLHFNFFFSGTVGCGDALGNGYHCSLHGCPSQHV